MLHLTDDERGVLITAAVALISAVLGVVTTMFKRLSVLMASVDEAKTKTETVRAQVQNSHGTNLRDDLDRIHDTVDMLVKGLDAEKHYRSKQDGRNESMIVENSRRIGSLEGKLDWLKEVNDNGFK